MFGDVWKIGNQSILIESIIYHLQQNYIIKYVHKASTQGDNHVPENIKPKFITCAAWSR